MTEITIAAQIACVMRQLSYSRAFLGESTLTSQWEAVLATLRRVQANSNIDGGKFYRENIPRQHASDCAIHNPFAGPEGGGGVCDCGFERGLIKRVENTLFEEHASDCAIYLTPPAECDCSSECVRPAGFGIPPEETDIGRPEE